RRRCRWAGGPGLRQESSGETQRGKELHVFPMVVDCSGTDDRLLSSVTQSTEVRGGMTGSKNQCGAGRQPARRLVTAAGPPRRRQGPIANRPQVTNLPHKISSANRRP